MRKVHQGNATKEISSPYERKGGTWRLLGKAQKKRKNQARIWRLIGIRENENGQRRLWAYSRRVPYLSDISLFCDGFGDARRHENTSTTEDKVLIGVKDCIAVFIKRDQLVAPGKNL